MGASTKMSSEINKKLWYLDTDRIDEINRNAGFVIAVLDAIGVMAGGKDEIQGETYEAEEKMERVKKILQGSKGGKAA